MPYQFTINDIEVRHPNNWQSIVLGYDFDGKKAGPKEIAQLVWCDAETRAQFEDAAGVMPCTNLTFKILFRCNEQDDYEEIFATNIEPKELLFPCDSCNVETPTKRQGASSVMDEQGNEEVCSFTQLDLDLFQYQSGGTYTDPGSNSNVSASFISLVDLVNAFINYYYPGTASLIDSLPCNDSSFYEPATAIIEPVGIPAGVTEITIRGEFGQVYNITIDVGAFATPDEYLTLICQALCCVPDGETISMGALEFNSRIAFCNVDNGVLTISAYWDFESVELTVDGMVPFWYTENITPQQKSSQDIYISPKGLFGNQVCLSWNDLKTLICKLQGGYIKEIHDSDRFEFRKQCELGTQLPNTSPENIVIDSADKAVKGANKEWTVNKVVTGHEFRSEDFDGDSNTTDGTWIWQGDVLPGPIGFPVDQCLDITENCIAEIEGYIELTNIGPGTQRANIQIVHIPLGGAANVIDSQSVDITQNNSHVFLIGSADYGFPRIGSMPFLAVGDQICVQWDGVVIGGIPTGAGIQVVLPDSFWQIRCEVCGGDPFLNEDDIYNIPQYSLLSDYIGCSGVKKCMIDKQFYVGLGFAFSQKLQGLKDYSDTHFITYRAPGGGARRFPKCFYFQNTYTQICDAYVGQFVEFDYYNAPLQLPQMLNSMLCQIPSNVRVNSYEWNINVDGVGAITKTSTQTIVELVGTGKKSMIKFEKCSNEFDLVRAIQYGEVNIDLCDENGTAIIKDFGMTLGNNRTGVYQVFI